RKYHVAGGDRFLFCSDCVTDMLSVQEIEMILRQEKTPESAAARLVQAVLNNGGKDNITAIVCDSLR
ncbi:MAG: serine/threonine-protein phosphatase, partial [Ruminococcus sp.]|nr:serine/threonine-protein phosphatase [Ruminococcus sp.]